MQLVSNTAGPGCGTIPGTGGRSNCCASAVLDANQPCIVNGKQAPCVIEGYTPAPATLDGTLAPYGEVWRWLALYHTVQRSNKIP